MSVKFSKKFSVKEISQEDLHKKIEKLHQHLASNCFVDFAFLLKSIVQLSKKKGGATGKDSTSFGSSSPDHVAIFTTSLTEGPFVGTDPHIKNIRGEQIIIDTLSDSKHGADFPTIEGNEIIRDLMMRRNSDGLNILEQCCGILFEHQEERFLMYVLSEVPDSCQYLYKTND